MNAKSFLNSKVRLRIVSSDTTHTLSSISKANVRLYDITQIDIFTTDVTILTTDLNSVSNICQRRGDTLAVHKRYGPLWPILSILKRPALIGGLILFLVAALFIPSRIFFIDIQGNRTIPNKILVEHAQQAGIHFGAAGRSVRSESIKNQLLEQIPQLQWVGVNTYGCIAVISVIERELQQDRIDPKPISNIIAMCDGIIKEITVEQGTALCNIGQAVTKGQILVSGYSDCGIAVKAQRAKAEIHAFTKRNIEATALVCNTLRGVISQREQNFSIIIGKKRINFWKDSGISDAGCVKMYEERYVTLPGGFILPFGIAKEELIWYDDVAAQTAGEPDDWLQKWLDDYILQQMVCGQILDKDISTQCRNGVCNVNASYTCVELIGNNRDEEFLDFYGKNN